MPLQFHKQGKSEEPWGNCLPAALQNTRIGLKYIKFPNVPPTSNFSPLLTVAKLHWLSAVRTVLLRTPCYVVANRYTLSCCICLRPHAIQEVRGPEEAAATLQEEFFFYLYQWQGEMQPVLSSTVTPCHLHTGELLLAQLFPGYFNITHWSSSPINKLHAHQWQHRDSSDADKFRLYLRAKELGLKLLIF